MNIFHAQKVELDVFVKRLVLIPLSGRPIRHRVDLRPRIDHIHERRVRVRLQHVIQHFLVLHAPSAETGQRLTAATDARLILVQIGENRQTTARPEPRATDKRRCTRR